MLDLRGKRLEFGKQNLSGNRAPVRMMNGRNAVSTGLGDLILDSGASQLVLFGVDPDRGGRRSIRTVAGSRIAGKQFSILVMSPRGDQ